MFCCFCTKSSPVIPIAPLPEYTDALSLLWLDNRELDIADLSVLHMPYGRSIKIYHITSLKELENACLGKLFKSAIYPGKKASSHSPRSFHAVIVGNWTSTGKKAERSFSQIRNILEEFSWPETPFFVHETASAAVSESTRALFFKTLTSSWKADLTQYAINHFNPVMEPTPRPSASALSTRHERTFRLPMKISEKYHPQSLARSTSVAISSSGADTPHHIFFPTTSAVVKIEPIPSPSVPESMPVHTWKVSVAAKSVTTRSAAGAGPTVILDLPSTTSVFTRDPIVSLMDQLKAKAEGPAERASVVYHQHALLEAFDVERLCKRGLSRAQAHHFRLALVYSDMGKLSHYQQWLKEPSKNSTELFNSLQLKSESPLSLLLKELTGGKPFLNPEFSHDELRLIFKSVPMLVAYFHEFQGMHVAQCQLLRGEITPSDFREIVLGFYGHNGPGDPSFEIEGQRPFWSTIPQIFLARLSALAQEGGLPKKAPTLFHGTSFIHEDGVFRYHDPQTALAYEHMIFDRFDGYRNSIKIREEIRFLPSIEAEVETMLGPNYNTRIALVYDETVLLPRMLHKGHIDPTEYERLAKATRELRIRVEFIHAEILKRVHEAPQLLADLRAGKPIESIMVSYKDTLLSAVPIRRFTRREIGPWDSDSAQFFRQFMDSNVRVTVMEIDQARFGIYQDFYQKEASSLPPVSS